LSGGSRELRAHPRKQAELPVIVADSDNRVEGEICFDTRDLSLTGAFLRSDLLFEVGEELDLAFLLPEGRTVRARGRVVHVVREPRDTNVAGMGISFTNLSDRDREAVRAFLATG